MRTLPDLLEKNRQWAQRMREGRPDFFATLAAQQAPHYLWIGCSDSRVPANEIVGLLPGEMFVHRNIANLVLHTDMNCLSVLQYAVEFLKVRHVIVCGHYGCGGVKASLEPQPHGLVDNWLRNIRETCRKHKKALESLADEDARLRRLCEFNVMEQVVNVANTTIVQDAWARGQNLSIHGWIYDVADGLLKSLDVCLLSTGECSDLQCRLDTE